jgi:hypothetical protein
MVNFYLHHSFCSNSNEVQNPESSTNASSEAEKEIDANLHGSNVFEKNDESITSTAHNNCF